MNVRLLLRVVPLAFLVAACCDSFHDPGYDWSASFDGYDSRQVHQLPDGGYVIIGSLPARLSRVDGRFRSTWTLDYGGSWHLNTRSVIVTSDSGCLLTGDNSSFGAWVLKADARGSTNWKTEFEGLRHEGGYVYSACQTADGGYVTTGGHGGLITLVKLGAGGAQEWQAYGDTGYGDWVAQTTDHGYLVACASPARLCRFDSTGHVVFTRSLDDIDLKSLNYAYLTPEGDCVLVDAGSPPRVVKLDPAGSLKWQWLFEPGGYAWLSSVQPTSEGGFILAGALWKRRGDIALVKLDSSGTEEWTRAIGGDDDESGTWAEQTADGGYVVAGTARWDNFFGYQQSAIRIKKLDTSGN